jgi:hypothetical protein
MMSGNSLDRTPIQLMLNGLVSIKMIYIPPNMFSTPNETLGSVLGMLKVKKVKESSGRIYYDPINLISSPLSAERYQQYDCWIFIVMIKQNIQFNLHSSESLTKFLTDCKTYLNDLYFQANKNLKPYFMTF